MFSWLSFSVPEKFSIVYLLLFGADNVDLCAHESTSIKSFGAITRLLPMYGIPFIKTILFDLVLKLILLLYYRNSYQFQIRMNFFLILTLLIVLHRSLRMGQLQHHHCP